MIVLTESYLSKRGYCCKNNCRHCPYKETYYIIKTGDDLVFHIPASDPQLMEIDRKSMPFPIVVEDVTYNVTSYYKMKG